MKPRFREIVGTGGVGKGLVFRSSEVRTLGHNESRLATLTEIQDYCKLQIVFYYLATMFRSKTRVVALTMIGNDENGSQCINMLNGVGIDTSLVEVSTDVPTMLSVCLIYADNGGCNITTENSACALVSPDYINRCLQTVDLSEHSLVVALPEVPFESRKALLEAGKKTRAFCATNISSADAQQFLQEGLFGICNLITMNQDEFAALCKADSALSVDEARKQVERLTKEYPDTMMWITFGAEGSISAYHEQILYHEPLPNSKVASTAGAGDAGLAGILTGLTLGLPYQKQYEDQFFGQTPLTSAVELGILFSGISVESNNSIAEQLDGVMLKSKIDSSGWLVSQEFYEVIDTLIKNAHHRETC